MTKDLVKIIKREMDYFETVIIRRKYLGRAFVYLNTLFNFQPITVESVRALSVAGLFCIKIRSSLNDETLDTFCLLRAHFLRIRTVTVTIKVVILMKLKFFTSL
jgi:hypothetical protein